MTEVITYTVEWRYMYDGGWSGWANHTSGFETEDDAIKYCNDRIIGDYKTLAKNEYRVLKVTTTKKTELVELPEVLEDQYSIQTRFMWNGEMLKWQQMGSGYTFREVQDRLRVLRVNNTNYVNTGGNLHEYRAIKCVREVVDL